MNALKLAENIIQLRHEKKITQEQLADFVGVTKASVSKWETKQSMPDILLLPQLAAFFDVTIDELLGYEPQLSKEQIQKIYLELAADFAKISFEEVIEKAKSGTLEDPQKSATIIIKTDKACSKTLHLYGAGIDGTLQLEVPDITVKAIELRKQQNYEYPQGIDFIFVTADGELFSIPRLVMTKEEQ